MKKFLLCFILLLYPQGLNSHVSHYKNIKKIEMEIFKDGKNIGYCNYEFTKNNDSIKIYNETNFEVKLLGIKVFSINSVGTEIYKNNKLFSFIIFMNTIVILFFLFPSIRYIINYTPLYLFFIFIFLNKKLLKIL